MKSKRNLILSILFSLLVIIILGYILNNYAKSLQEENNLIEVSILDENETQINTSRVSDDSIDEKSFSNMYKDFDGIIKNIYKLNEKFYIVEILDEGYGYVNLLIETEEYQEKISDLKKDNHVKGTCNEYNNEFYRDCKYKVME